MHQKRNIGWIDCYRNELCRKNTKDWGDTMSNRLILIEGLDATGKSTLVTKIAKIFDATIIRNPPLVLDKRIAEVDLRTHFDEVAGTRRREFYRSANFISSEMARLAMENSWVIMDRYWPSTAAFSVMDDEESNWEPIGTYPSGFLKPDIVFFLTVSELERIARMKKRGINPTLEESRLAKEYRNRRAVMDRFRKFSDFEINTTTLNPDEVMNEIIEKILNMFPDSIRKISGD